jgi:hypothetical protein
LVLKKEKSKQRQWDDKQKQFGLVNPRVWVYSWQRNELLEYARKLRERGERELEAEDIRL